jgi:hypothetical protein
MSDNFDTAKNMLPMGQINEIQSQLRCANAYRGCKFFAMKHWCLCCMMLKAIGSDFFLYEDALQRQDPDCAFSMANWQKEEYDEKRKYWVRWCDNFPRGTIS